MAEVGIFEPLIITPNDVVLGGHRRLDAAARNGIEAVLVCVRDVPEDEQPGFIVHCNKARDKTTEQKAREAVALLEVEAVKARKRQAQGVANLKQGPDSPVVVNLPPPGNEPTGKARDVVARELGVSGKTVDAMIAVVDTIDELRAEGRDDDADKVAAALNDKSVRQATILA